MVFLLGVFSLVVVVTVLFGWLPKLMCRDSRGYLDMSYRLLKSVAVPDISQQCLRHLSAAAINLLSAGVGIHSSWCRDPTPFVEKCNLRSININ